MNFDEPNDLNDVAIFHSLFRLPILDKPTIPDSERIKLRISLLEEELSELKKAAFESDIVEVADALADLQYVLSGAILEFGLAEKFKSVFDEVQRSNMSKTCRNEEVAEKTRKFYFENKGGIESFIEKHDGVFLVYRKEDGKVLKSVEYSPADIKSILF